MYQTILVTLDATETDRPIIDHVKELAGRLGSRVVLLHVADGWAARRFGSDAVSEEVDQDGAYLDEVCREFEDAGVEARSVLAYGDPVAEIVGWVESNDCDLIAMSTHGHKALADLLFGWTASRVQHAVDVPVLMLRAG